MCLFPFQILAANLPYLASWVDKGGGCNVLYSLVYKLKNHKEHKVIILTFQKNVSDEKQNHPVHLQLNSIIL